MGHAAHYQVALSLVEVARDFAQGVIRPYYAAPKPGYPHTLVAALGGAGLLGLTVHKRYGGTEASLAVRLEVIRELSRCSLTIPAIAASHLRACTYIARHGSPAQKENLLPALARAELIAAHAHSENKNEARFRGPARVEKRSGRFVLNGQKGWVTNARDADLIIVIALSADGGTRHAVIVPRERFRDIALHEHRRPGLDDTSLTALTFTDYTLDPTRDLIGGLGTDVTPTYLGGQAEKALSMAARGAAVIEELENAFVHRLRRSADPHPVTLLRLGELRSRAAAARHAFAGALTQIDGERCPLETALSTRLFITRAVPEVIDLFLNGLGGRGYAEVSGETSGLLRDAASLIAAGSPLDRLAAELGALTLAEGYGS